MPDGTNNTDKDGKIRLTNQAVFSHYINSSLPAGDYVLIFYIDPFNDGDQTISGNSEGYVFEFTVKEATVTKMDRNNVIKFAHQHKNRVYGRSHVHRYEHSRTL